ncbi:MAG: hypothetical protein RR385_09680 [Clostridiales bacterium]
MAVQSVTAKINGQIHTLTYNSISGKYEATISAPSTSSYNNNAAHYYPVELTVADDAGNSTIVNDSHGSLGANLKLKVKEKVKPTVAFTSPTADATIINSKPQITALLRDNDSGIDTASIILKVDNVAVPVANINKSAVTGGYNIDYTPTSSLGDGNHTISLQVSDNDGNQCVATSNTFKVDTTPPVLSVTAPTVGLVTNVAALTVTGVTNDATSSPTTVAIKLNNTDQGGVTVNGGTGAYSKSITLTEGNNTIEVTATDSAGKTTTITRTVELDTVAPVISAVTITPNPVDCGATYIISVTATD